LPRNWFPQGTIWFTLFWRMMTVGSPGIWCESTNVRNETADDL
jgi:hypothetical protein